MRKKVESSLFCYHYPVTVQIEFIFHLRLDVLVELSTRICASSEVLSFGLH